MTTPTRKEALILGFGALSAVWALRRSKTPPIADVLGLTPPDVIYAAALSASRQRVVAALSDRVELWDLPHLGKPVRRLWGGAIRQALFTPDDAYVVLAGQSQLATVRVADGAVRMARTLSRPVRLLSVSADGAVVHCQEEVDGPPLLTQRRLDDGSTRAGVYLAERDWGILGVHKVADESRALCLVEDRAGQYLASADLATGHVTHFEPVDNGFRVAAATALGQPVGATVLSPDGDAVGEFRSGEFRRVGDLTAWRRAAACGPGPLFAAGFNADGTGAVVWGRGLAVYVP